MDTSAKVSFLNDLKICKSCQKTYVSHDIIPLCPDCRYEEAKHKVF